MVIFFITKQLKGQKIQPLEKTRKLSGLFLYFFCAKVFKCQEYVESFFFFFFAIFLLLGFNLYFRDFLNIYFCTKSCQKRVVNLRNIASRLDFFLGMLLLLDI